MPCFITLFFLILPLTNSYAKNNDTLVKFMKKTPIHQIQNHPEKIIELFNHYKRDVPPIFPQLNEEGRKVAFASLLAYQLKPYGASITPHGTLQELLHAKKLSCSQYTHLTYQLYRLLSPNCNIKNCANFNYTGWKWKNGSDHAQLFIENTGVPLILDPTIGLVGIATLHEVIDGRTIPQKDLKDFYQLNPNDTLKTFHDFILNLLLKGHFKANNLLYFYQTIHLYCGGVFDA